LISPKLGSKTLTKFLNKLKLPGKDRECSWPVVSVGVAMRRSGGNDKAPEQGGEGRLVSELESKYYFFSDISFTPLAVCM